MIIIGNADRNKLALHENDNKYFVDDYSLDLNNKNDSHSIIVNSIDVHGNILDIGCGPGYIGKKLKELAECHVDGIEIDKEAAKVAKTYYDDVYTISIEDEEKLKEKLKDKKYDYIIMADLIEHLTNPGVCLKNIFNILKDDGKLIISTPNIAHIDIIKNLINQKFNYNNTGILDQTHRVFFTESSFGDFIQNINKTYNLKYGVKVIGKTYLKEEDSSDEFLKEVIGDDLYVFQNIFCLDKSGKVLTNEVVDNYKKVNENFKNIEKDAKKADKKADLFKTQVDCSGLIIETQELRIQELLKYNKEYRDEVLRLQKTIDNILNSKSWKITKPLRKISERRARRK